ncbi:MAG: hypothetical protein ACFFBD_03940, partial [Candidatus Hodarchaeota archaeon]
EVILPESKELLLNKAYDLGIQYEKNDQKRKSRKIPRKYDEAKRFYCRKSNEYDSLRSVW